MPAYPAEPWYVGAQNDQLFLIDQPPRPSTDYQTGHDCTVIAKVYIEAAADRLAACVNACAGIRNPGAIPLLLPALVAAENFLAGFEDCDDPEDRPTSLPLVREAIRAAGTGGPPALPADAGHLLALALPYVEEALDDPLNKPARIRPLVAAIRAFLDQAGVPGASRDLGEKGEPC